MNLPVEPVDHGFQRVDQAEVVADQLAGHGGFQGGEPGPARAAPAPGRPVMTMLGQHRVDPVA